MSKTLNKTQQERLNEMLVIGKKLNSLGLSRQYPVIEELYTIINDYIKTGISIKGTLLLVEGKKKIYYDLNNKSGKDSTVCLKHHNF